LCALAMADQVKIPLDDALKALISFPGVHRRMNLFKWNDKLLVDDYAHHPNEIKSVLKTLQAFYKEHRKCVIFQPHLFSRTRDFMDDFALVLSKFDEVYLLDIYPAREKPIHGVTSKLLLKKIQSTKKEMISKDSINEIIINSNADVISVLGAGNITDNLNKEIFTNE